MSSGAGRANYGREQTPSGVWIEYNLDNPDSPPYIIWPTIQPSLDDEVIDDRGGIIDDDDGEEMEYGKWDWSSIAAEPSESNRDNILNDEAQDEDIMNHEEVGARRLELSGREAHTPVTEHTVEDSVDIYYNPRTGVGSIPAVYHHEIRQELIWAANMYGRYTHIQPRGHDSSDETSFFEEQREWGTQRANYPPITFEYQRLDRRDPEYKIEHWYYQGRIVLDCEGVPIKRFINLPDVLSSEYPGHHMEANRRQDSRIKDRDFAARMPPICAGRNRDGQMILRFPKSANTLASRRRRFRQRAGCLTWGNKPCPGMTRFLEEHLPQDLKDRNTTYGFRDLTNDEILIVQGQGSG